MNDDQTILNEAEILDALAHFSGWSLESKAISKLWTVKPYFKAVAFVNQIAWIAQMQNHHPDIELSWGRVHVRVTSHDVGGITMRDLKLVEAIENLPKDF